MTYHQYYANMIQYKENTMDFNKLKKNRKAALNKLQNELNESSGGNKKSHQDDRYWQPATDSVGNGYAVVRFLPPSDPDGDCWVRLFSHGFKGPTGMWYIENSRTTLGEQDPVGELNNQLWNSGQEDEARRQKRRLHFISNVLIVKDSANPENEGTVRLFKYGKKIFEKLNQAMNPEFEDEEALNPFDMWEGANFAIKIRQVEGYRNYDKSSFMTPSPVADDDSEIETIWKRSHDLSELISEKNFKSYDELKEKLNKVLGLGSVTPAAQVMVEDAKEDVVAAPAPVAKAEPAPAPKAAPAPAASDDDDLDLDALLKDLDD